MELALERPWWQKLTQQVTDITHWTLVANLPPTKKYILLGAPHTSNWDLPIALMIMGSLGIRPRWIGKDSLFKGIAGPFMRWLGGIPVERGARKNFVGQIVDLYNQSKELVIAIAPEGTRKFVDHWKSGFYHIALGAKIPIAMGFADYSRKIFGVGGYFTPSGNPEEDLTILRVFYADKIGKRPEGIGKIHFLERRSHTIRK